MSISASTTTFNWRAFSKRFKKSQKLTPIEFLDTLQAGLLAERNTLTFSNINMHIRCCKVLQSICRSVGSNIKSAGGMKFTMVDIKGNVCDYEAKDRFRIAEPLLQVAFLRSAVRQMVPSETLPAGSFDDVANIINQMVTTEGHAEADKVKRIYDAYEVRTNL